MTRLFAMSLALILCFFFFVAPVGAQIVPDYSAPDLTLRLSPEYPAPGDSITVTAESTLIDLRSSDISWAVNGTLARSGRGLSTFHVTAGALGTETVVEITVTPRGRDAVSAEALIRPVEIDLLWEADSYTPPYFRTRALASPGSRLHMQALVHFTIGGVSVPNADITYTWRRNGAVIASASGVGRSSADIAAPVLFATDTISVEASHESGLAGSASVTIASREPVLALYEAHPLFGPMYHAAISPQNILSGVEMSFVAVPYFASAKAANSADLHFAWRVNGRDIANDPERQNELTINATGSTGRALIELALTSLSNFYINSSGAWFVALSGGNPSGFSPFDQQL